MVISSSWSPFPVKDSLRYSPLIGNNNLNFRGISDLFILINYEELAFSMIHMSSRHSLVLWYPYIVFIHALFMFL